MLAADRLVAFFVLAGLIAVGGPGPAIAAHASAVVVRDALHACLIALCAIQ